MSTLYWTKAEILRVVRSACCHFALRTKTTGMSNRAAANIPSWVNERVAKWSESHCWCKWKMCRCTLNLTLYLLVEVLVDFPLMGESQHAADHACVFDGPSHVADLRPAVFVFYLHDALRDGQPLLGHGDHGPETHLLYLVFIDVSLFATNRGRLWVCL